MNYSEEYAGKTQYTGRVRSSEVSDVRCIASDEDALDRCVS